MKKSPWNLTEEKLEQQSIFSFQFTYIADSKKQEHSHLHHHGYELMQKESVWLGQLLCTEIFKKMLSGDWTSALWTASQNLPLTF